ncbi:MAG: DUF1501 domain-containing protein [Bryobacteraceae bacterium]
MSISEDRRQFLTRAGMGFGALAANAILAGHQAKGGTAKSVISLFMHGGPSHLDTFDPKPRLNKMHGQLVPDSFGDVRLQFSTFKERPILGSGRKFARHGASGLEISDLFPHLAKHADKLAVIRSMNHDGFTHTAALNWLNNGWPRLGRPSVGSWVVYGLGSEAKDLPAFVVMLEGGIKSGPPVYSSGFLPAAYQATTLRSSGAPILYANRADGVSERTQRDMLDTLKWFNEKHQAARADDTDLSARIGAYELAFKMQIAVPELSDLTKESAATKALYGMDSATTLEFGTRCLMARRLVERGVRFVQLWSGTSTGEGDWDGHKGCEKNHERQAAKTDKCVAGLLEDLAARGLLNETLVVWGGEFGRTPTSDGNANGGGDNFGRDHNPYGFSIWMAGGGIKGGKVIGATDEIGLRAIQDPVHVHDLHASVLAMLGLDHEKLIFPFQGRDFRLTDVHGNTSLVGKLRA